MIHDAPVCPLRQIRLDPGMRELRRARMVIQHSRLGLRSREMSRFARFSGARKSGRIGSGDRPCSTTQACLRSAEASAPGAGGVAAQDCSIRITSHQAAHASANVDSRALAPPGGEASERARGSWRAGERRVAARPVGAHRRALRFPPFPDTLGRSSLGSELLDEDNE
jgi:hypothetical protein